MYEGTPGQGGGRGGEGVGAGWESVFLKKQAVEFPVIFLVCFRTRLHTVAWFWPRGGAGIVSSKVSERLKKTNLRLPKPQRSVPKIYVESEE